MTDRTVVVTGATGFVGTHVVEALRNRGLRVRALVRATSVTDRLKALGVEPFVASLQDEDGLAVALSGADAVIHLAALTHARTESELQHVNGAGTEVLAKAALRAARPGAPLRFVYLSSLAAVGPSSEKPLGASDVPAPLTAYGRSKLSGEKLLQRVAATSGASSGASKIDAVTLRAPAVYGPGDRELLRFFKLAKLGIVPVPSGPDRPLQLVHVKDLARGIMMAALHDSIRGTYNVADSQAYLFRDICDLIGKAVGRKPVFMPVPRSAITAAAGVSELFSTVSGRSTMFNRDKVRELLAPGWLCETASAREAFGFAAGIPLADGLQSTAVWYRTNGWL